MAIIEQEFLELTQNLDLAAFWAENDQCQPFTTSKPRCSASFSPDDHWIFEFMQVPSTVRYYQDKSYRDSLHGEVNQISVHSEFYREYCFPVLQTVLNALAPGHARRYQHSDSAMGHLIDQQYELGIREVNYGPTVDAGLIREKMPDALIHGQLPPFLLRNGSPQAIE